MRLNTFWTLQQSFTLRLLMPGQLVQGLAVQGLAGLAVQGSPKQGLAVQGLAGRVQLEQELVEQVQLGQELARQEWLERHWRVLPGRAQLGLVPKQELPTLGVPGRVLEQVPGPELVGRVQARQGLPVLGPFPL